MFVVTDGGEDPLVSKIPDSSNSPGRTKHPESVGRQVGLVVSPGKNEAEAIDGIRNTIVKNKIVFEKFKKLIYCYMSF